MSVINRMLSLYNSVEESHIFHTILGVMLRDMKRLPDESIEALAADCFTAPSSVSRLIRSLGYRNFSEFKFALGSYLKNYGFENRLYPTDPVVKKSGQPGRDYLQNAVNTISFFQTSVEDEQIRGAAELLNAADQVYILYSGEGSANIHPLQCELFTAGKDVRFFSEPARMEEKLGDMGPHALAFLIMESSHDNYGAIELLLPQIHDTGAEILMIASDVSPLFVQVGATVLRYPRDLTLNSFLYCYIYLNLLTIWFRDEYIDKAGQKQIEI